ncbi:DMT family transporter [Desulforhopalus vacuolatus]|uniref:DMT family transporter n=1 Tax=Desulforhopalus vacuolatus TaxID=40414 RepID=UPI001964A3D1|nr:DMT family transporter [Desulforhopalus vacuolatus]MBM9521198.1 DMT family transporter [Desulforhopalus vacuolatus]
MSTAKLATLGVLFVAFIWGVEFVLIHNAISILKPHSFNAIRFGVASLSLVVCLYSQKKRNHFNLLTFKHGCFLGLLLYLGFTCQTFGLLYTSVSNCAFITSLSVVLVPIIALFILGDNLRIQTFTGVLLAAAGLYFLTAAGEVPFNTGDSITLIGALMFALHIVYTGKYSQKHEVMPLTLVQLGTVTVLSLCSVLITEDWRVLADIRIIGKPDVLWGIFVASILGTSLAIFVQTQAQNYISSTRVALIFSLEPIFASLTAFFVLNEQLPAAGSAGAAMILTGIFFAEVPLTKIKAVLRAEGK